MPRNRQHASHRPNRAVEPQLAEKHEPVDALGGQCAERHEEADRDRKVETRSGLSLITGREADGDAPRRDREAGVGERGRDALAALLHLAGRKPDDRPVRQPLGDVDLDADVVGVDSEHGGGADGGEHAATLGIAADERVIIALPNRTE